MQKVVTSLLTIIISTWPLSAVSLYSGGNLTSTPLFPAVGNLTACHLDLSSELFGGVTVACSTLDRGRCCPVLAAWLFAAHARSALQAVTLPPPDSDVVNPLMPDEDFEKCVDMLHQSLEARNIRLPRVNGSCDTVLCYCGIRLHQIGSLSCPVNMFNVTATSSEGGDHKPLSNSSSQMVKPLSGVLELEKECLNASYHGCSRCLQSLQKLKGGKPLSKKSSVTDRATKMFNRDCQLMGLTWLLAKNKTLYIPTVSAVLRALLYTTHPPTQPYKCSPDQENMPLAVDSLQFQKLDSSSSSSNGFAISNVCFVHVMMMVAMVVGLV